MAASARQAPEAMSTVGRLLPSCGGSGSATAPRVMRMPRRRRWPWPPTAWRSAAPPSHIYRQYEDRMGRHDWRDNGDRATGDPHVEQDAHPCHADAVGNRDCAAERGPEGLLTRRARWSCPSPRRAAPRHRPGGARARARKRAMKSAAPRPSALANPNSAEIMRMPHAVRADRDHLHCPAPAAGPPMSSRSRFEVGYGGLPAEFFSECQFESLEDISRDRRGRRSRPHGRGRCGVSSPPQSRAQRIEAELGVTLCRRGPRGFVLTDEGMLVAETCRSLNSLVRNVPSGSAISPRRCEAGSRSRSYPAWSASLSMQPSRFHGRHPTWRS